MRTIRIAAFAFLLLTVFSFLRVKSHPIADSPIENPPAAIHSFSSDKTILIVSIAVPVVLIVVCIFVISVCCVCCSRSKSEDGTNSEVEESVAEETGPLLESQTISPEIMEMLRKAAPPPEERGKRKPFKVTADMFKFKGPLQIKIFTNPPKCHALHGTEEVFNFKGDFVFDDSLNEAYEMGWDVEEIKYIYDSTPTKRTSKKARPFEDAKQLSSSATRRNSKSTRSDGKKLLKSGRSSQKKVNTTTSSVTEQLSSAKAFK